MSQVEYADGEARERPETVAEMQAFLGDPRWIHYAAMLNRPGVLDCIQSLEHTHYQPDTPRNALFHMRLIKWQDLLWGLMSIPVDEKDFMQRAAAANGLRVANGAPACISGDGVSRFPAHNDRVFTLENVSGHPVYGKRRH